MDESKPELDGDCSQERVCEHKESFGFTAARLDKPVNRERVVGVLAIFFVCVFTYAIFAMVIARTIIIPAAYPTSINGTIPGDPQYYNALALKKVAEIRARGATAFELRPEGQGPAGIASLSYLVVDSPYIVVLVNAFLHSVSAILMVLILRQWFTLRTSILASLPLVISPYMIIWFSQLNKDSFTLSGAMLFTYGLLRVTSRDRTLREVIEAVLIVVTGAALISLMRPYMIQMMIPITILILLVIAGAYIWSHSKTGEFVRLIASAVIILMSLSSMTNGATSDETLIGFDVDAVHPVSPGSVAQECLAKIRKPSWQNERYLPDYLNRKLKAMMGERCLIFTLLDSQTNPATRYSILDTNKLPSGSLEALAYFPRAALIGIFAPWPDRWFYNQTNRSFFYTVVPIETALLYAGIVGFVFWLIRRKEWRSLIPITLSLSMMTLYGAAVPFLGALYRHRYSWWMILLCFGIAALISTNKNFKNLTIRN